eukprot:CAMPEP_0119102278 /NCGR_PEP_ID=MMETSP1180-20130426/1071_1 /TAXON_ID=3052 ORGANISM="Chlamydomonas cf sp, Strain CCMP681" /NCGR_SAMPLE_ID=MMETSP1180 /ASSEMBLY_ACC=CAM_ASM_000741 /LENGTH=129 /DNA_ID=CAMNT_0007086531 /DNA_START=72 /DNA_END=461 /DNA_ORIENTATION=-
MATVVSADLVTLLQLRLVRLSELLYATVGELQRDAAGQGTNYDAGGRAQGFATELSDCVVGLQELVHKLPPQPPQPLLMIKQLQQQSSNLSQQLQQEQQQAELKLQQAQELHAVLAGAMLAHSATLAAS